MYTWVLYNSSVLFSLEDVNADVGLKQQNLFWHVILFIIIFAVNSEDFDAFQIWFIGTTRCRRATFWSCSWITGFLKREYAWIILLKARVYILLAIFVTWIYNFLICLWATETEFLTVIWSLHYKDFIKHHVAHSLMEDVLKLFIFYKSKKFTCCLIF